MPRERRTFTAKFKRQMVQLYENGKTRAAIVKEYELSPSALDRWIKQANTSDFFSIEGEPELNRAQSLLVTQYRAQIRSSISQFMKWYRYNNPNKYR